MPAPSLRRYSKAAADFSTTSAVVVVPAVPASRALVVSKVVVAANAATTVNVRVAGVSIANGVSLGGGDVYAESALTVLAGETLDVSTSATGAIAVSVFGQEVDNA